MVSELINWKVYTVECIKVVWDTTLLVSMGYINEFVNVFK